ncbi:MAG: hypothetical protein ABI551_16610 [Polyangiaceae bacterium]
MRLFPLLVIASALACAACAPKEDDNTIQPTMPQPMAPSTPYMNGDDTAMAKPMPSPDSSSNDEDTTSTPTTVEVHNDCTDAVPIFIGDRPRFGSGTKVALSADSTTSVPRNGDGTVTIWLIDQNDNGLASVHVTKRMKRVEIGRSCRTIDSK